MILRAQNQLREAGHEAVGDEPGVLGSATKVALQAFQRERGLDITGLLDVDTLQRLDEAAWTLGSRLLYLISPHLRGDDVAQLQEALALLGFDPGRIDGIFGIQTQQALQEFQRNCALPVTGELTRTTLGELERFAPRTPGRQTVIEARDRAHQGALADGDVVVLHGDQRLSDATAAVLPREIIVSTLGEEMPSEVARHASEAKAALVVSFLHREGTTVEVRYFQGYRSRSIRGEMLVHSLAESLSSRNVLMRGMSLPLLRETTMTCVQIVADGDSLNTRRDIAQALRQTLTRVVHSH